MLFFLRKKEEMERYEILRDIGSGKFGVAKLVKDKWSGELYAVKYIERGQKVVGDSDHCARSVLMNPVRLCFHFFVA